MKILWHNGTIFTMEAAGDSIEAVLTENGKIIDMGSYEGLQDQADRRLDLKGAFVYPGFVDSHMHMIGHGSKLQSLDLSKASSAEEMMEMLQAASEQLGEEDWLIGEGWNENNFPDQRILTVAELDAITQAPVFLSRTCRHAALVNSEALQRAGIDRTTADPEDGTIVRDEQGEATGYLLEGAQDLVQQLIGEPTEEMLISSLETSVNDLLALGLTGAVTDDLGYYGDYCKPFHAFQHVLGEKKKFRAHLLRRSTIFQQMMEENPSYDDEWITLGEMKFFVDGALGGQTALLSAPYADKADTSGIAVHTDEEIVSLVKLARSYGEAIAVHVIGDGAVEKILDVIEEYPVAEGKRDRLIHVNVLRDDLVDRMLKLPVILDIQPVFVSSDFPWVMDRLGPERLDWAYAWKSLLDKGFICGAGSDAPIEEADPLLGIYAAVTRRKVGQSHEGYLPEEKLSRFEAIRLFTTGSAETIGQAHRRGKISVGYDADFTVLNQNLFDIPEDEIVRTAVVMTVVDGDVMYENKQYDQKEKDF